MGPGSCSTAAPRPHWVRLRFLACTGGLLLRALVCWVWQETGAQFGVATAWTGGGASGRPGVVLCQQYVSVVLSACVSGCFGTGRTDVDRDVPAACCPPPPAGQSNACWWYGCSRICDQCQHSLCVRACLSTATTRIADAGMSTALPPSCSLLQVKAMLAGAMAAAVCVISANQCSHEGLSALLTKQERVKGEALERWLQHVGKQRQHCCCREVSEAGKGCCTCRAMRR